MATAYPPRVDPQRDPAEEAARRRLARQLAAEVGRLLLEAARDHPPPWPEGEAMVDRSAGAPAPAIVRKPRRQRRGGAG